MNDILRDAIGNEDMTPIEIDAAEAELTRLREERDNCVSLAWHNEVTTRLRPDLSRKYTQRGTGNVEAPCVTCDEAVIADPPAEEKA